MWRERDCFSLSELRHALMGSAGLGPTGNGRIPDGLARDQPDPDAIKMFVGQMPRHMDENDIRAMFEEFGPVHQINVLRDKVTGQSKEPGPGHHKG
ncbi:CUGBP Elav-like family member 5 [Pollicipes pollicipes]|uniref:CUGBP Elav-like family member 5 n=1 Tax=Pollicipes pollicipes TaxID=41117 RepID=UPI001884F0B2|nr:CUGBP Elav-like family member 5 [Pollicipes pollicipes]